MRYLDKRETDHAYYFVVPSERPPGDQSPIETPEWVDSKIQRMLDFLVAAEMFVLAGTNNDGKYPTKIFPVELQHVDGLVRSYVKIEIRITYKVFPLDPNRLSHRVNTVVAGARDAANSNTTFVDFVARQIVKL